MNVLARLRRFWLDVHLWLGVGLFVPVVVLGLSGAVLVYHDELERVVHPHRYAVSAGPELAPSLYGAAAADALGARYQITGLRFPRDTGDPLIAQARAKGRPQPGARPETRSVFMDPASARVIEIANTRAGFFGLMHQVHGSLLIPDIGRKVVGWLGWGMLISSLTGLWLWWPRGGALWKALRWQRGPRTTYNLHHLMGFWLAIPLAILSATGIYISFPQSARSLTQTFVPMSAPEPRGGNPVARPHTDIDLAASAARATAPEGRLLGLSVPSKGRGKAPVVWRAELRVPGSAKPIQVVVDDATGESVRRGSRAAGDGMPLLMRRVHDGIDQHPVWRVLVFLGGVAPALLGVTGIVMWLRRRAARRALRRGAEKSHTSN